VGSRKRRPAQEGDAAAASRGGGSMRGTIWYLQWLRALGALAIVLLHAVRTLELRPVLLAAAPGLIWAEDLALIALTRWAVPVFLMMSGALMLDPARPMPARKLGRHVWRIAFVLLTFGLAFCLMEAVFDARTLDGQVLATAVLNLLTGHSWDHLWYLYATLGLYLATPALRWLVRRLPWEGLALVCLVGWVLCCGPRTLVLAGRAGPGTVVLADALGWAFPAPYYLAGYVLHHDGGRLARSAVRRGLVYALGLASLVAMTWLAAARGMVWLGLPECLAIMPYGAAFFLAARRLLDARQVGARWILTLADYSMGIYVIHPLFAHVLVLLPGMDQAFAAAGSPLALLALQVAMVLAGVFGSILVTRSVRRIPVFRGKI